MGWLILKLNRKLRGQGPGDIRVEKGSNGQPKDKYWRDRLKDAVIDDCCELVKPSSRKKKTKDVTDD